MTKSEKPYFVGFVISLILLVGSEWIANVDLAIASLTLFLITTWLTYETGSFICSMKFESKRFYFSGFVSGICFTTIFLILRNLDLTRNLNLGMSLISMISIYEIGLFISKEFIKERNTHVSQEKIYKYYSAQRSTGK